MFGNKGGIMKKYFLIILLAVLSFTLTGCGVKGEKELTSIPSELQGVYQGGKYYSGGNEGILAHSDWYFFYKLEDNVIKRKICMISKLYNKTVEDCNFNDSQTGLYATTTYNIKDIKKKSDSENVDFNLYINQETYKCYTTSNSISCTSDEANHYTWSKIK